MRDIPKHHQGTVQPIRRSLWTAKETVHNYCDETVSILLTSIFPLQSITMKLLSEIWEIESDIDKVEEEYQLRSTDLLSDGKHAEGKP